MISLLLGIWMVLAAVPGTTPLAWGGETVQVDIREWPVPWKGTRPRDPFVNRNHQVWFAGQFGDYVARFDPSVGQFHRFDLEAGAGPHNVMIGDDGMVWYAGIAGGHIGKLDPTTGEITQLPMPDPETQDPHTLVQDAKGAIWFTVITANFIGKLTPATGKIRLIPLPTSNALPYGIVLDPHDRPWFTEFGTNQVGLVDPDSMSIKEFSLPRENARPRRLAATSDGRIWYVDYAQGYLGSLDPESGEIKEWRMPGGEEAHPYGMTVDDRDRLWFVETGLQPNRLVGFDSEMEVFINITSIPSGGVRVRNMDYDQENQAIWFATDADTVGRAEIP